MYHRTLVLVVAVGMGFGIWMSCSKDNGISGNSPVATAATKPAFGRSSSTDFHPQTNVNYDPFADMKLDERMEGIRS